jgi:hypothetical protein
LHGGGGGIRSGGGFHGDSRATMGRGFHTGAPGRTVTSGISHANLLANISPARLGRHGFSKSRSGSPPFVGFGPFGFGPLGFGPFGFGFFGFNQFGFNPVGCFGCGFGFGINSFAGFGFNQFGLRPFGCLGCGFGSGFGFGFGGPWFVSNWSGGLPDLNDDPPAAFEPVLYHPLPPYPGPVFAPDSYAPPCPSVSPASQPTAPTSSPHAATTNEASWFGAGGSPSDRGFAVDSVLSDSPADRIGIRPGDIVVRINCQEIRSTQDIESDITNTSGPIWVSYMIKGAWLTDKKIIR